jgi:hypothetical protein
MADSLIYRIITAQRFAFAKHGAGAGVDNVWEQRKLEARKMPENAARREAAVPSVQCTLCWLALRSDITFPIMM